VDYPTSKDVVEKAIRHYLGQGYIKRWYASDRILEFKNESIIGFKSYDSGWEKYQGTAKHLIWCDEEASYDIYQEILVRLVDFKGDFICTETPLQGMSWTYDEIWENRDTNPDLGVWVIPTFENQENLPEGEIERMIATMPAEVVEARVHGRFIEFAGLIYKEFRRAIHCVEPFDIPKTWTRVRAIDPGVNNPTACLWVAIDRDNNFWVYDEYYESEKTVAENAKNIKTQSGKDEINLTLIDPTAVNRSPVDKVSVREAYQREGIFTKPGSRDVQARIDAVKQRLRLNPKTEKPTIYFFSHLRHIFREIERYRWDTYRHRAEEHNPKEKPRKVMDHLCNDLEYICAEDPINTSGYEDADRKVFEHTEGRVTAYG
jgi:phage terminase large subunit-like protein